jgi:hypothetical protein
MLGKLGKIQAVLNDDWKEVQCCINVTEGSVPCLDNFISLNYFDCQSV